MSNFWKDLRKPIFTLAPMEDVTDTAFRELVLGISDPNFLQVLFTEFTSVDGLMHEVGRVKVSHRLIVSESEWSLLRKKGVKIVAQIWGSDPDKFYHATKWITENYEFDGIDINMGCPVKKIFKQGACSALIDQPELAADIINATQQGTHLPVSVKTRIGVKKVDTERWIQQLLETDPAAIILHGRIQKQMSDGEANWEEIAKAVELRNTSRKEIPILGNGDLFSMELAEQRIKESGVDGVMIGRGIFHDPWIFNPSIQQNTKEEKLKLMMQHIELFRNAWGDERNFNILKRFFKIYINGFQGASALRGEIMNTTTLNQVITIMQNQ